ncbi:MAG TPA: hypothetical protein VK659_30005 [Asanoa sp.]|nr:hypothetical protein [Asanoa sp.]
MTLPQRTTTVPTPDEIERAAHLAAEQLTNPKYVAGYLGGEMQALLRKYPDEPGIRACTALWVAHVRATVHGPAADRTADAAVLGRLRTHDDRPPAALRQVDDPVAPVAPKPLVDEFPVELDPLAPANAAYVIDREYDWWTRVGNAWQYTDRDGTHVGYGTLTTARLIEFWSPLRWYDARHNHIAIAGGAR